MLIQRSIGPVYVDKDQRGQSDKNAIFGWTLIVPSGWGSAFWHSLAFADTRIGGLRERAQQYFEAGCPSFPEDYACTHAFKIEIDKKAKDLSARWHRTPVAKRINYAKLKTDSPWRPAFSESLSSKLDCLKRCAENGAKDAEEARKAQDVLGHEDERSPYLVNGPLMAKVLPEALAAMRSSESYATIMQNLQKAYEKYVNLYRTKRHLEPNRPLIIDAFVKVRLNPLSRGSPKYNAIIYMLTEGQVCLIRNQLINGRTKNDIVSLLEQQEEMEAPEAGQRPGQQLRESRMDEEEDDIDQEYQHIDSPRSAVKVSLASSSSISSAELQNLAQTGAAYLSDTFKQRNHWIHYYRQYVTI